mmetsp:Transcript_11648/g.31778  ORF Transcript_11648/g.31778 Transcript_11648/m.31778 type:complete len:100 (-) Transcript_11648:146-445(-)
MRRYHGNGERSDGSEGDEGREGDDGDGNEGHKGHEGHGGEHVIASIAVAIASIVVAISFVPDARLRLSGCSRAHCTAQVPLCRLTGPAAAFQTSLGLQD